jgi:DNA-directed RNA polymerase specialized sigma24 family protein
MTRQSEGKLPAVSGAACFATTHWSVVLTARDGNESHVHAALSRLCEVYWYPLYAYLRRRNFAPPDAEDLTQSFLAYLLSRDFLARVEPQRGKFRSFLLASLNHFVSDHFDREHRQKRGGGHRVLSLDAASAEQRYSLEPVEEMDPQKIFERRWALTLVEAALFRVEAEAASAGKSELFQWLKAALVGERNAVSYSQIGQLLGLREEAVKVAAHRLRLRFRELFREEIAQTVSQPAEIEEEIQFLFQVLSR